MIRFKLNLSKYCIETALKRLHNKMISDYFNAEEKMPTAEQKIEAVGRLLTELNFSSLRTRFPDLAGHSDKEILLNIDSSGRPHIFIAENEIDI
ncbi:MAG: hypothetical protein R6U50_10280 [Desulfobacterales bacterium]